MLTGQVLPAPTQPRSLQAPTAPGPPHLPSDPIHPPQPRPHSSKGPRSPPQLRLSRRPPRTSPLLTQVPSRSAGPHCQETRFGTLPLFGSPAAPALTQATPQPLGPTPSPGPGPHTPAGRSLTPTVTLSPQAMLTASGHDPSRPLPPRPTRPTVFMAMSKMSQPHGVQKWSALPQSQTPCMDPRLREHTSFTSSSCYAGKRSLRECDAGATIPGSNLSTGTTHKGPWCVPGCDRSRDGTLHLRRLHGGPQCAQTGGARGASPSVPPHPTIYPCNSDPSSHTPWPPPASPGRAPSPASHTTPRPPAHGPKYLLPWLSVQNLPQPPSKQTLRSQPPQQAESSTPMPPARATLPAHRATAPGPPSAAPPCPQASSLSPANFREAGPHWLPRASHTGGAQ